MPTSRRSRWGWAPSCRRAAARLSCGQRQRILIARALIHRPRVLFFDEATSALDNRTQEIVTASTRTLAATRLVIAHRLSTIIDADRIVVLDKGAVAQEGTFAELMAQPDGLFFRLASRQLTARGDPPAISAGGGPAAGRVSLSWHCPVIFPRGYPGCEHSHGGIMVNAHPNLPHVSVPPGIAVGS